MLTLIPKTITSVIQKLYMTLFPKTIILLIVVTRFWPQIWKLHYFYTIIQLPYFHDHYINYILLIHKLFWPNSAVRWILIRATTGWCMQVWMVCPVVFSYILSFNARPKDQYTTHLTQECNSLLSFTSFRVNSSWGRSVVCSLSSLLKLNCFSCILTCCISCILMCCACDILAGCFSPPPPPLHPDLLHLLYPDVLCLWHPSWLLLPPPPPPSILTCCISCILMCCACDILAGCFSPPPPPSWLAASLVSWCAVPVTS